MMPGTVLGVEIMGGVVDLGRRCIRHNGASEIVELIKAEGHQLCEHTAAMPEHERPHAPLLMAELMDSGALGEGLLPLAYEARVSGLLAPDAQFLPCRLRVWAFVAELRACGTALDGCELIASHLGGTRTLHSQQQAVAARAPWISLAPWRAYHEMKSYASIDLPSSEYTPLSPEALVLDAALGQPPPADGSLRLAALCAGRACQCHQPHQSPLTPSGARRCSSRQSAWWNALDSHRVGPSTQSRCARRRSRSPPTRRALGSTLPMRSRL